MGMQICRLAFRKHLEKYTGLCYNTPKPATTNPLYSPRHFITADKILISIHRTAIIIWVIKIIRTAGATSYKQNCLRCKSLQRVGVRGNGFGVIQKALVLQGFSASQTEKSGKKGRMIPNRYRYLSDIE